MDQDVIAALVRTIELKDLSTAAHSWRVVLYARALAAKFGVGGAELESITRGAALHDLGKIDIPDAILQKPGRLTPEEFEVIKTHPVLGHERLVRMGETDPIVLGLVRSHHERVDGHGYPDGLAGEQIPSAARYFAVIDAFDALTSVRPYRREVGPHAAERALDELAAGVGAHYCHECVSAFADLYRAGELRWILEHYSDQRSEPFSPPRIMVHPGPRPAARSPDRV